MNRFDIIAVGVDQECRKIAGTIILPRARCAVVTTAGLQTFAVEFPDRGVIGCTERDVGAGGGRALVQMQP